MKSTAYLSSARVYSLVMLVTVYLCLNLATTFARRVGLLQEARNAFAIEYVLAHGREDALRSGTERQGGYDALRSVAGIGSVSAKQVPLRNPHQDWFGPATVPGWSVLVHRSNGKQWLAAAEEREVKIAEQEGVDAQSQADGGTSKSESTTADAPVAPQPQNPKKKVSRALTTLRVVATELGLKDTDTNEYNLLLRDIEREVVDREVALPGIGLSFKSESAPWIIGVLTIGLLLLMRNQLRTVILDPELAIDEPWIVVDISRGVERLVANGWLLSILLAPWIAASSVLVVLSAGVVADGPMISGLRIVTVSMATVAMVLLGGWASLTVSADLMRLRRLRTLHIRQTPSA